MINKYVEPEPYFPSWARFCKMVYNYRKSQQSGLKLNKVMDMDYLHLLDDDTRSFLVEEFFLQWYKDYMNAYGRRVDVTTQYDRRDSYNNCRYIEDVISDLESRNDEKVIKMWERKFVNAYNIRDYLPSKMFDENRIIDYLDSRRSK